MFLSGMEQNTQIRTAAPVQHATGSPALAWTATHGPCAAGPQLAPEGNFPPSWGSLGGLAESLRTAGVPPFLRTPESCRRSPKHPTAPGVVRDPTRHVTCCFVFAMAGAANATFGLVLLLLHRVLGSQTLSYCLKRQGSVAGNEVGPSFFFRLGCRA